MYSIILYSKLSDLQFLAGCHRLIVHFWVFQMLHPDAAKKNKKRQISSPIEHFTILGPENLLSDVFQQHKIIGSKSFKVLKLRIVRSGSDGGKN